MKILSRLDRHISILTHGLLTLLFVFIPLFSLPNLTYAATIDPTCNGGDGINTALGCIPFKSDNNQFTSSLLSFLAGISGAIALVVMLMATFQIMTGGDNAEQVKKGKELFTAAITGLLFIIFSVVLLRIIAGDIIQLPGFQQTQTGIRAQ